MRLAVKILTFLLLVVMALSAYVWVEYQRFTTEPITVSEEGYVFTIPQGSNLRKTSKQIKALGLSTLPEFYLPLYGRLENKAHLIKAGEYLIEANTTLPQLLEQFINGQVVQYSFTIVEGMTSQQLIDLIVNDERLINSFSNADLKSVMTALNLPDNHGEGEFLPETYNFIAGTTANKLLMRAHSSMSKELAKAWENKADNLPYKSAYEALIMASIIEKESGIAEERPQIAGVFVRRLKKGMRLQTDPTVIYGMGKAYNGNIRRKDLRKDTPYNTYTRSGLPPSPIALPSKEAIDAALHPLAGKSLYFVATGKEGRHVFSNTLSAHNKAVRKYQLKK